MDFASAVAILFNIGVVNQSSLQLTLCSKDKISRSSKYYFFLDPCLLLSTALTHVSCDLFVPVVLRFLVPYSKKERITHIVKLK